MQARRSIRSFVLRAGRTTPAQQRALEELWPVYGIENSDAPLDLDAIFGRRAPRCLEIGFGAGECIGALAAANPGTDYLGVEVHRAGVGRLLLHAAAARLANLRVICRDVVEVFAHNLADESLDEVLIFFPDPWHKSRHIKRRLIDAAFVTILADKLRVGGTLRLATDWAPYAEQMLAACSGEARLESLSEDGGYVPRPQLRPPTRFERRGERLGHRVFDLAYRKQDAGAAARRLTESALR